MRRSTVSSILLGWFLLPFVYSETSEFLRTCADSSPSSVQELKTLVESGADVHVLSDGGESSLHLSCIYNNPDKISLLLTAGADPNRRANSKPSSLDMTPLTWCTYGRYTTSVANFIKDERTNVNLIVRNEAGALITALDIAHKIDDPATADLLTSAGAKTYAELKDSLGHQSPSFKALLPPNNKSEEEAEAEEEEEEEEDHRELRAINDYSSLSEASIAKDVTNSSRNSNVSLQSECEQDSVVYVKSLQDPCGAQMNTQAPDDFDILFGTNDYGSFTAHCKRQRAPVWVDRIYNLVLNGYYNSNYFFRVIPGKYIQFGTNGDPQVSNCYNFQSPDLAPCAVLEPQPNEMPINTEDIHGLSNVFGTVSMSTSYNESTGTTWNATAELFINIGNNSNLDPMLFVPVCTISAVEMKNVVLTFPSFGEVQELGGDGVSLDQLYAEGNAYIESNSEWASMAETTQVRISCPATTTITSSSKSRSITTTTTTSGRGVSSSSSIQQDDKGKNYYKGTCGPCTTTTTTTDTTSASTSTAYSAAILVDKSVAYAYYDIEQQAWKCPLSTEDVCAQQPLL